MGRRLAAQPENCLLSKWVLLEVDTMYICMYMYICILWKMLKWKYLCASIYSCSLYILSNIYMYIYIHTWLQYVLQNRLCYYRQKKYYCYVIRWLDLPHNCHTIGQLLYIYTNLTHCDQCRRNWKMVRANFNVHLPKTELRWSVLGPTTSVTSSALCSCHWNGSSSMM